MRWNPVIEIKNGSAWTVLPLSAFSGGLNVDSSQGQATTMSMTIARSVAPANPSEWVLKPVRVSFVADGQSVQLFEGLIRTVRLDVVQGVVEYQSASATQQILMASEDILATLNAAVPWSTAVLGEREKLTRDEQFEKLLSASDFVIGSNGLQPLDSLVKFHKGLGEPLGPDLSYNPLHRDADVIAKESAAGTVGSAVSVDFSAPKIVAGAGVFVPTDAIAVAPLNRVNCIVHHRYARLVQERFNFTYLGGNIITDHVEVGSKWLTLESVDAAIAKTQMYPVFKYIENAPLYGNVGSGTNPVYAGALPGVRETLVQKFNISLARRYVQQCEMIYEREVRCNDSIIRYGEKADKVEITISDSTDWAPYLSHKLSPKFVANGFMEVRDAADFAALGVKSIATREAAEAALNVLVKQATRRIKVAHAASLTNEIGASTLINTSYSTLLNPTSAAMALGADAALNTSLWRVSGLVSSLVAKLNAKGSATMDIKMITNIAPGVTGAAPVVLPNSITPVPSPVGYDGSILPQTSFTGVMP